MRVRIRALVFFVFLAALVFAGVAYVRHQQVRSWLLQIRDPKDGDASVAVDGILVRSRQDRGLVRELAALLDAPEDRARSLAAYTLSGVEPPPVEATGELVRFLATEGERSQGGFQRQPKNSAVSALGRIASDDRRALLALVWALEDEEWTVRALAARSLARIGPDARIAVPALVDRLRRNRWEDDRVEALHALARIGPAARAAVPAIAEALTDNENHSLHLFQMNLSPPHSWFTEAGVNRNAAFALLAIGPEAAPALEGASQGPNATARAIAAETALWPGRWAEATKLRLGLEGIGHGLARSKPAARSDAGPLAIEGILAEGPLIPASAIPVLVARLADSDPAVRRGAAQVLGAMGDGARSAAPNLATLKGARDATVRRAAALALGQIGPGAAAQFPALLEMIGDPDPGVRISAAEAMGGLGPAAEGAVPRLIARLSVGKPDALASTAEALGALGPTARPATSPLLALRAHSSPAVRREVALALGSIGFRGGPAIPALAEAMKDADPVVRAAAVTALRTLNSSDARALAAFATALNDTDPAIQRAAIRALVRLGPVATETLTHALENPTPAVRRSAIAELVKLGPEAMAGQIQGLLSKDPDVVRTANAALLETKGDPIPALVALLKAKDQPAPGVVGWILYRRDHRKAAAALLPLAKDPDTKVRREVIQALSRLLDAPDEIVDALAEATRDTSAEVRREAVSGLGQALGRAKAPERTDRGITALIGALDDEAVGGAAAEALGRLGALASRDVRPLLVKLCDTNSRVSYHAEHVLCLIGPDAIPPLVKVLRKKHDPDPRRLIQWARMRTLDCLGRIGDMYSSDTTAYSALVVAMTDDDSVIRIQAEQALIRGTATPYQRVSRAVVAALVDDSAEVRSAAANFLVKRPISHAADVPGLLRALKHPDPFIRRIAADSLGGLGKGMTNAATTELQGLAKDDPDGKVRGAASSALKKLGAG